MRVRTKDEYLRKCERRLASRKPRRRSRGTTVSVRPYVGAFKRLSWTDLIVAFGVPV